MMVAMKTRGGRKDQKTLQKILLPGFLISPCRKDILKFKSGSLMFLSKEIHVIGPYI
jgi:hypothetical protein